MKNTLLKTLRAVVGLFQETLETWGQNQPDVHAAAIAFVTLFTLAPLVLLLLTMVGQAYEQQIYERLMGGVASKLGQDAANLLGEMVTSRKAASSGDVTAVISFVVLVFSAGGLFGRLRGSLNSMWNLMPRPQTDVKRSIYVMIKQLVVPGAIVVSIGLALFGALMINTFVSITYEQYLRPFLGGLALPAPDTSRWPAPIVNFVIFAVMFKLLPQARIRWRDVLPGAVLTALLFWLGSHAIQLYLRYFFTASVYGAAGSIIVILLWVDYSALIVLFGAAFINVYARTFGHPIVPDPDMMFKPGVQQ